MKLYFFDIASSHQETVVDSAEYESLAAKTITPTSSNYHSDNEAGLKWAHSGAGPFVTYEEHKQALAKTEDENRKLRAALADAVWREMNGEKPVVVLDKHGITLESA